MSKLAQMMAQRNAARKAAAPTKIVDPVEPKTATPKEVVSFEAKSSGSGLAQISTELTKELTAAEQRVADQREAGVYDLDPRAHEIMGTEADALINTMQELDAAIIEKTPEIRTLSRDIRQNLERYPELTHILTDEQLHIVVQGYLIIANVKTTPATKQGKTAAANKKADAGIKAAAAKTMDELF